MSFTRVLATGNGKLEFRLAIEGLPIEFVSAATMERAAVPATGTSGRYNGLQRDGLAFTESVDIPAARLTVSGLSIRIADINYRATQAFARLPTKTTYLASDLTASATSMTVSSTSGWSAGNVLHIGTEAILVNGITSGTVFDITGGRGAYGSIAQKHFTENGYNLRIPEITDYPATLEGRRVYLYAYGEGDSPTGNGTQVFLGIIKGEARLDGNLGEWNLSVDSVTRLLDQDIGYDTTNTELSLRGIYHPWNNPFNAYIQECDSANFTSSTFTNGSTFPVQMIGHWETQFAFVAALRTALQSADSSFTQGGQFSADVVDDYRIKIIYTTGPTTARYARLSVPSCAIYQQDGGWQYWYKEDGTTTSTLAADTSYYAFLHTSTPRTASLRVDYIPYTSGASDISQSATYPANRVYVNGAIPFTSGTPTSVLVKNTNQKYLFPLAWQVTSYDTDARWIEFDSAQMWATPPQEGTRISAPERYDLMGGRIFGGGVSDQASADGNPGNYEDSNYSFDFVTANYITAQNIAEYLDYLVDNSANYCNVGVIPFLTTTDYDQVLSERHLDPAIDNRPWADPRTYVIGKSKTLGTVVAEEMKLIGCFPCLGSTGKLRFRKLQIPAPGMPTSFSIDSTSTYYGDGPPTWERSSLGLINGLEIQSGYSAIDDKHTSQPVIVRDVTGFGQTKISKTMGIKPYSRAISEPGLSEATLIASEYFGAFGYPYMIVTVGVSMKLFTTALVGTFGTIVSGMLPDETDGTRGYSDAKYGLVIGRAWDLATGQGRLTLYIPIMRAAGYTPSARVTAVSATGGSNQYDVTLSDAQWDALTSTYYDENATVSSYFPAGTKVLVYEWDNSAPTTREGTVDSVQSSTVLRITFTASWTPGALSTTNAWNIGYNVAATTDLTTTQKLYAYIAGTDHKIDFSTSTDAKVFGA